MKSYSPKLTLGVSHVIGNIKPVIGILERIIEEGMVIGTEAYSHPIVNKNIWEEEAPEFFDAIANYAISNKCTWVPLGRYEDFLNLRKIVDDKESKFNYLIQKEKLIQALIHAGYDLNGPMGLFDFSYSFEDLNHAEYISMRLRNRFYKEWGVDFCERRDDTLVELVDYHNPDIIVVGQQHVPALMAKYPKMEIIMCRYVPINQVNDEFG